MHGNLGEYNIVKSQVGELHTIHSVTYKWASSPEHSPASTPLTYIHRIHRDCCPESGRRSPILRALFQTNKYLNTEKGHIRNF